MSINPMQSAHDAPRCKVKSKPHRSALPVASGKWLSSLRDARRGRWRAGRKRNGNFRHGGRAKDANDASRYVNELVRLVRGTD